MAPALEPAPLRTGEPQLDGHSHDSSWPVLVRMLTDSSCAAVFLIFDLHPQLRGAFRNPVARTKGQRFRFFARILRRSGVGPSEITLGICVFPAE